MPNRENPTHDRVTARVDPSNKTQQAAKDSCDVNLIMKTYEKTGVLTHENANMPVYGDFSNSGDYQAARNAVNAAQSEFALLSADIRRRFNNNPEEMLLFLDEPSNLDEAVKLGLVEDHLEVKSPIRRMEPEPEPEPDRAPPIPENPSPVAGGA